MNIMTPRPWLPQGELGPGALDVLYFPSEEGLGTPAPHFQVNWRAWHLPRTGSHTIWPPRFLSLTGSG